MSVVSERPSRRYSSQKPMNRSGRPGDLSSRSAVGIDMGQPFLMPQFSAAASEGVKIDLNEDNWCDNTTVVTGNTSEHSYGGVPERFYNSPQTIGKNVARRCSRLSWLCSAFIVSLSSLLSAPLMASIPYIISTLNLPEYEWAPMQCEIDCQGYLLNMAGKSALLLLAFYVLYWRRNTADMPRLFLMRAAFVLFTLFVLFAFWLFYIVRIVIERNSNYSYVTSYALSLLDILLFVHCIWIFFELRQFRPVYSVTIVRDPDGETHTHEIGHMSIQEAAVQVLRIYHTYFPSYNSYLDYSRQSAATAGVPSGFKLYDIEGRGEGTTLSEASARILVEATSRRRMAGHNDMLYEELEWEKRYKKRKYRLLSCTEEVFSQVQAVRNNNSNQKPFAQMDTTAAAKTVLGGIAKPLNRFLRFTRQQPNHLPKQVSEHLEQCLAYRFSARTFLQRFFSNKNPPSEIVSQSKWSILCNMQASSSLKHGASFVLRSHNTNSSESGIQLYCTFSAFPFYNITEQNTPEKSKFELKITTDQGF
ncbi:strabismus protein domain-containing protein [Ditylenchus destructor]|uniref:Strabismus protein domain-containing protein n=1 Tax=Ditylenchus destructor TaxID=166010 RepID=A0AAD4RC18_9BILA|nr:strabismus protein domain-containing protein [Ditylenchus destructor]